MGGETLSSGDVTEMVVSASPCLCFNSELIRSLYAQAAGMEKHGPSTPRSPRRVEDCSECSPIQLLCRERVVFFLCHL
jgi:hypothetical protein